MSDTTDITSDVTGVSPDISTDRSQVGGEGAEQASATRRRRTGGGLSAMLLPELQSLAASLGISGIARMRKGELINAIQERQSSDSRRSEVAARVEAPRAEIRADVRDGDWRADERGERSTPASPRVEPANDHVVPAPDRVEPARAEPARVEPARVEPTRVEPTPVEPARVEPGSGRAEPVEERAVGRASRPAGPPEPRSWSDSRPDSAVVAEPTVDRSGDGAGRVERPRQERGGRTAGPIDRGDRTERTNDRSERAERPERTNERADRGGERVERGERPDRTNDRGAVERADRGGERAAHGDDDDGDNNRRGRRSRFRDRRRGRSERAPGESSNDLQVADDDVLVPVAGILDVLDNYAFIRTTGYLSGPNDVYVSMAQVKKYGLRRGDAVTGAVRQAREGEQRRDKYNPLVRLDTINGMDPDEAKRRPEFYKLTPLYPQERLRLETEPHILTTRVIDLVMPIGKGQRALIVSPPKAGKTMVLQAIANAITHNNPECHLMVVLVDERPEEVTDMQRSVKGEVIASTFDRPPQDHTTVAELAIERAKRLVELGHDVLVLLDSITRLGRAYNLAAPASGRILSGGIDSTALYPPKRFLGAARNIENGGSLTILATALVETGSMMDTVIFEEFKGTGNAELRLDRKIADKRVWPAIDIDPSGTRKEEILLAPDELGIVIKLRRVLHALDSQEALNLLLERLKKTRTNVEFLMQIAQTTPGE